MRAILRGFQLRLANFNQCIKCCLPAWHAVGIDKITGRGRKRRVSIRNVVHANPAISHPDHPALNFFGYARLCPKVPSLIVDLDMATCVNPSLLRVHWMDPQFRLGVCSCQRGQCPAFIIKGVKRRDRASLPELERIQCSGVVLRRRAGWQWGESHFLRSLTPEFHFPRRGMEAQVWVDYR